MYCGCAAFFEEPCRQSTHAPMWTFLKSAQKSTTYPQKSPVYLPKSPTHPQKKPYILGLCSFL